MYPEATQEETFRTREELLSHLDAEQTRKYCAFCLILRPREEPVRVEWDHDQFKSRNC